MLQNTKLQSELRRIVKTDNIIEDIILFGSTARGKEKPHDVDILLIFKNSVEKTVEYKIRKMLELFYQNVSIISKTLKTVLDPAFDARESVLFEGISLLDTKMYCSKYGFSAVGMFRYEFKEWNKLQKTKFYYALNGRGSLEGFVTKTKGIKLSDNLILVPVYNVELFRDFLESWKIEYKLIPLLVPERLNRKDLLVRV